MKRIVVLVVAVAATVFASPGVALGVESVTVTPYATCSSGGVRVHNQTQAEVEVRLYLDGSPVFSGWIAVAAGQNKLLSGTAPASGSGTYTTYQRGPGDSEILLATTAYTRPTYCDAFDVTYTDTCDKVTVTIKNNYGSDVVFTIAQTSGATYPITTLAVLNGQTAATDIVINSAIKEIGLYLESAGDYIDRYTPKGEGNCATPPPSPSDPPTSPTPSDPPSSPGPSDTPTSPQPSPTASPAPSPGPDLPVTGLSLTLIVVAGLAFIGVGAGTVFAVRKMRP